MFLSQSLDASLIPDQRNLTVHANERLLRDTTWVKKDIRPSYYGQGDSLSPSFVQGSPSTVLLIAKQRNRQLVLPESTHRWH